MKRKTARLLAVLLLCLPIYGGSQVAMGRCLERLPLPALPQVQACWSLGPYELAIMSACLLVLALTLALRYR